ncbi:hypothetical protein [Stutzerimonas kunmingensis]|uniref:hypothetical protein n=1 Tax=Stutzerimonas kunmingensis TaxID=1211807 RepID=UPI002FC6BE53
MSQNHTESLLAAAAKLTPPVGVVGAAAAGMTLQDWVWAVTLAYTVLMTLKLLWDWIVYPAVKRRQRKD